MTEVYFATNRKPDPARPGGFGAELADFDPAAITYAKADVPNPGSDTVGAISDVNMGRFSDALTEAIVGSGKNLFVFIHGFDNAFAAALARAAFNADFYRATGQRGADTVCIAFTWPSEGELIDSPQLDSAYRRDQQAAGASAYHLCRFLEEIDRLRLLYAERNPLGRLFLLAHSMGNWALQAALTEWHQAHPLPADMFDEVILAAADEVWDTFEAPNDTRLSRIADIGVRVTLYSSRRDFVLQLSQALNRNIPRLGQDGPKDKADPTRYSTQVFRVMDCTDVGDFDWPFLLERTHQYYRLSPTVAGDIAAVMVGSALPVGGLGTLQAPTAWG